MTEQEYGQRFEEAFGTKVPWHATEEHAKFCEEMRREKEEIIKLVESSTESE